jgi:dTMP kinase
MKRQIGAFVTFEGGEGVGKSTLISSLAQWLSGEFGSDQVLKTREPGGTVIADAIRGLFKNPPEGGTIGGLTEALLVSAARADHVENKIKPALSRGVWVLCDRYTDSTRVYQGILGGVSYQDVESLIQMTTRGLNPDLTILLTCNPEVSRARRMNADHNRDDAARYDQADQNFHQRIEQGFLRIAGQYPDRFFLVDANHSPDVVFAAAKKAIEDRLVNEQMR